MFPTLVGGGQPGLGPCSRLTPAVLGAIQPPEAFAESKNGLGATWAGARLRGSQEPDPLHWPLTPPQDVHLWGSSSLI